MARQAFCKKKLQCKNESHCRNREKMPYVFTQLMPDFLIVFDCLVELSWMLTGHFIFSRDHNPHERVTTFKSESAQLVVGSDSHSTFALSLKKFIYFSFFFVLQSDARKRAVRIWGLEKCPKYFLAVNKKAGVAFEHTSPVLRRQKGTCFWPGTTSSKSQPLSLMIQTRSPSKPTRRT